MLGPTLFDKNMFEYQGLICKTQKAGQVYEKIKLY